MNYIELYFLAENKTSTEICSIYWALDEKGDFKNTISKIAKEFGKTSYEVQKTVKQDCIAFSTAISCPECDLPYQYKNRSDYKNTKKHISIKCSDCIELDKLNEEIKKQSALDAHFESCQKYPFSLESLTFYDAICLLSIVRYQASEDLQYLKPYTSNQTDFLSPRYEYDIDIYKNLIEKNIIAISPRTALDAVKFDDEGKISYHIDRAYWEIIIDQNKYSSITTFIEELEHKLSFMEWEDSWYDEANDLCKDVALQESLAYLDFIMRDHRFNFVAGKKTKLIINKVLEKHSVAQLCSLIWSCGKDAAAYYMRSDIPKKQAANSVIGGIERKYERYITNGWEIKPAKRNFNLPISTMSQVLYGTTLHTDDGGFYTPPDKII